MKETMGGSELDRALDEATSDENWTTSPKVLQIIADHSFNQFKLINLITLY